MATQISGVPQAVPAVGIHIARVGSLFQSVNVIFAQALLRFTPLMVACFLTGHRVALAGQLQEVERCSPDQRCRDRRRHVRSV